MINEWKQYPKDTVDCTTGIQDKAVFLIRKNDLAQHTELILNNPGKRNAMNSAFLQTLNRMLSEAEARKETRLLVIKSAVPAVFCAGVDLSELHHFKSAEQARDFALLFDRTLINLLKFSKPILALMDGLAFGGGFALASAADIRIMTSNGKIAFPAGRLGAILPPAATLMLQALCGAGTSRDLLLTGRTVQADEAQRLGLVNRLAGAGDAESILEETMAAMLASTDLALELTRRTVNQPLLSAIEKFNHTAAENFAFLSITDEWQKRMAAFVKKR